MSSVWHFAAPYTQRLSAILQQEELSEVLMADSRVFGLHIFCYLLDFLSYGAK